MFPLVKQRKPIVVRGAHIRESVLAPVGQSTTLSVKNVTPRAIPMAAMVIVKSAGRTLPKVKSGNESRTKGNPIEEHIYKT